MKLFFVFTVVMSILVSVLNSLATTQLPPDCECKHTHKHEIDEFFAKFFLFHQDFRTRRSGIVSGYGKKAPINNRYRGKNSMQATCNTHIHLLKWPFLFCFEGSFKSSLDVWLYVGLIVCACHTDFNNSFLPAIRCICSAPFANKQDLLIRVDMATRFVNQTIAWFANITKEIQEISRSGSYICKISRLD